MAQFNLVLNNNQHMFENKTKHNTSKKFSLKVLRRTNIFLLPLIPIFMRSEYKKFYFLIIYYRFLFSKKMKNT